MAAPTFVSEYESTWGVATTPRLVSVTTAVGDVLVFCGMTESNDVLTTPTGGTSLSWTLKESINQSGYGSVYLWYATATTAETFNISCTNSGVGTNFWGYNVFRFSGSNGIGSSAQGNVATSTAQISITTTQINSSVVVFNVDFLAIDGASRTWVTASIGTFTEQTYSFNTSHYTVYGGRHLDAGSIATYTVGLSAPTGQTYSMVAIEVKGASAATGPVGQQKIVSQGIKRAAIY